VFVVSSAHEITGSPDGVMSWPITTFTLPNMPAPWISHWYGKDPAENVLLKEKLGLLSV
jgi:hypothetical protein